MAQTYKEKWAVTVGKDTFVLNDREKNLLLANSEARFVSLNELVINPAFVQSMKLIEKDGPERIEASPLPNLTEEQRRKNIEKLREIRKKLRL